MGLNKTLVIVDVQLEFDKYIQHNLVEELTKYTEEFDNIYQIWDTHNNASEPTYDFPKQIDAIPKKFGKKHFNDNVKEFINKHKNDKEGKTYKLTNGDGYIVRVDNNHDWFYVNPEICELISKIKDDKVILVGGAEGECIEDVYQAFLAFDIDATINDKYVYSAKTSKKDKVQESKILTFQQFIYNGK
jgi:hypothetical protein